MCCHAPYNTQSGSFEVWKDITLMETVCIISLEGIGESQRVRLCHSHPIVLCGKTLAIKKLNAFIVTSSFVSTRWGWWQAGRRGRREK